MKKPPESASAAEEDEFRQAMADVTPLASDSNTRPFTPVKQDKNFHSRSTSDQAASPFSDHHANPTPATSYLRAGLDKRLLRDLRRGRWPVQDEMDLHGQTLQQARNSLHAFLQHALSHDMRCINIIHGKGWQADGSEGPLKIHVRHWLPQFPQVLAFCEPPLHAGGSGAVRVLLKSGGL